MSAVVWRRRWWQPLLAALLIFIGMVLFVMWIWSHPRRRILRDYEITDDIGLVTYVMTLLISGGTPVGGPASVTLSVRPDRLV